MIIPVFPRVESVARTNREIALVNATPKRHSWKTLRIKKARRNDQRNNRIAHIHLRHTAKTCYEVFGADDPTTNVHLFILKEATVTLQITLSSENELIRTNGHEHEPKQNHPLQTVAAIRDVVIAAMQTRRESP